MDFLQATLNNAWFDKHPGKIAGKEYETTSFMFPIMVKGTKEDVLRVTGFDDADKNKRKRKALAKAKAIKLKLKLLENANK